MENILVAGAGVLGSQIGFQSAFKGKNVIFYEINDDALAKAKDRVKKLRDTYLAEFDDIEKNLEKDVHNFPRGLVDDAESLTQEDVKVLKQQVNEAFDGIRYTTDLDEGAKDADFVIESIIEDEAIKKDFYESLAPHLPEKTILGSNSSTMLPSTFAESTGRPEKYLHFHFANSIWKNNITEIMAHSETSQETIDAVNQFSEDIAMIPVNIKKENPGYLMNALLIPFLFAAQRLYVEDIASVEDIDKAWKLATGAPRGPFEIHDVVGMNVVYQIGKVRPHADEPGTTEYKIVELFKKMIDEGKLGRETGEGFYKYD